MDWIDASQQPKLHIIERTDAANEEFAKNGYGHEAIVIGKEQLDMLFQGKGVAWSDGEYTTAIYLAEDALDES